MRTHEVERRSFVTLSLSAAVTGAPAILSAQSRSDTVRVAFVGVGSRGTYLLSEMMKIPGVKVVGVCDVLPERADNAATTVAQAGGSARTWTDYRKMLDEQKEIDAVIQAIPSYLHKDVDVAVLQADKHLYGEKPLARTPEGCRRVAEAARKAKGIFQVGLNGRYDPKSRASQDFIAAGGIGKVAVGQGIRFGGDFSELIKRGFGQWYVDQAKSGGMLVDVAVHELDQFNWAIGSHPAWAFAEASTAVLANVPPGRTVGDNYQLILGYPNGQRVALSMHAFDPPNFSGWPPIRRVFGSKGAVDLNHAVWQSRDEKKSAQLEVANADKNSVQLALGDFFASVRAGKKPFADIDVALTATLTVLLCEKATQLRRIVKWEEV